MNMIYFVWVLYVTGSIDSDSYVDLSDAIIAEYPPAPAIVQWLYKDFK